MATLVTSLRGHVIRMAVWPPKLQKLATKVLLYFSIENDHSSFVFPVPGESSTVFVLLRPLK